MSKDIVELLHGSYRDPINGIVVVSPKLLVKAASEIESLRAKIAKLEAKVTDAGWQADYDREMEPYRRSEW